MPIREPTDGEEPLPEKKPTVEISVEDIECLLDPEKPLDEAGIDAALEEAARQQEDFQTDNDLSKPFVKQ
jgi:hypothetical protein